jgi:microcystin-dependent protein
MYAGTATDARNYLAADISAFIRTQITDGVCHGILNALAVSQHGAGDRSVDVATGKGWVYGYFVSNDAALNLAVDTNTSGNPRIDRVILRNTVASGISIVILKGTPGAVPAAPALTQNSTTYEISLAQLALANGYTQILTANITDERSYVTVKRFADTVLVMDGNIATGGFNATNVADAILGDTTTEGDIMNQAQYAAAAAYFNAPAGTVWHFGVASIPSGFLICDGAAVSRTTYAKLFAAIGILWGAGDGTTTFNVPNLTGYILVGRDPGQAAFDVVGDIGGAATVTLDATMIPAHTHPAYSVPGSYPGTTGGTAATGGAVNTWAPATGSTGGGGAHNNLGPYLKLSYGIKV